MKPIRKATLLATISMALATPTSSPPAGLQGESIVPTRQRYQQIVNHFEQAVRANLATLDRVEDISEAIAVSRRTLSRAVRVIHATTPLRFAQSLRLAEARKALLSAHAASDTVTAVAMRFGFRELGRFATTYQAAFGESPSETMRRSAPASHCR